MRGIILKILIDQAISIW